MVRATRGGRQAQEIFRPLPALIDDRWRTRFGAGAIGHLEQALRAVFDELPIDPPAYLPVVYPDAERQGGAGAPQGDPIGPRRVASTGPASRPCSRGSSWPSRSTSRAESRISLPDRCQHAARARPDRRTRPRPAAADRRVEGGQRDVRGLAGTTRLCRDASPTRPRAAARCSASPRKVCKAQQKCRRLLDATEMSWRTTYGAVAVDDLRAALEPLVGDGTLASSPLARGSSPTRTTGAPRVRQAPATLPHYPMVLHRGGYPDGS